MTTTIPRRTVLQAAAAALGLLVMAPLTGSAATRMTQGAGLKFEVYKDSRGGFRWRLKAGNGKVLATSGEGYKAKADCRNGIELIKRGAAAAPIEEVL
jgi:uncharacterized protein YegP (UPF0339 family)